MDDVFKALADPSRRRLLDRLNERSGQTLTELCADLHMARQSVSKHLAILEAANLIATVRRGREKLHYVNAVPINEIAERWISHYDRGRVHALSDLKSALEAATVPDPEFVYVTYIKTTPELLWSALTQPAFTSRYWEITLDCDWQPGSVMTWTRDGVEQAGPEQVVLEADPFTRLAYTWHDFTPAFNPDLDPELLSRIAAEPRSRVSFDLEPQGDQVKLTVTHGGFADDGSTVLSMIGGGWPVVISSLKTLLETGDAEVLAACLATAT